MTTQLKRLTLTRLLVLTSGAAGQAQEQSTADAPESTSGNGRT